MNKNKPGKPALEKELQKRRNFSVTDSRMETLKEIGGGNNSSKGLRKIVDVYVEFKEVRDLVEANED